MKKQFIILQILLFGFLPFSDVFGQFSATTGPAGPTYYFSENIQLEASSFCGSTAETCVQVNLLVHYTGSTSGTVSSAYQYLSLGETRSISAQVPLGATVSGFAWQFTMPNGSYIVESSWGYGNYSTQTTYDSWCTGSCPVDVLGIVLERL